MAFNAIAIADRLIRNNGMAMVLRSDLTGDRDCFGVELDFTVQERIGKLVNPTDRLFILTAVGLAIPPDAEHDKLVTFVQPPSDPPVQYELLNLYAPVGRLAPAGVPIYWELRVR